LFQGGRPNTDARYLQDFQSVPEVKELRNETNRERERDREIEREREKERQGNELGRGTAY